MGSEQSRLVSAFAACSLHLMIPKLCNVFVLLSVE